MRDIRIESETESGRGWWFHARFEHACSATPQKRSPLQAPAPSAPQDPASAPVNDPDAPAERCADVHLSWADYEYWCHGARAPADVVRALIRFLTQQDGFEIPPKFDAATARRWFPDLDHALLSPW